MIRVHWLGRAPQPFPPSARPSYRILDSTMDLRDQLQATLGDSYAIERELTGGGMSRVFLAREARLDRAVVIKVLAPDLAQGVSCERFEREIQLAASMQQANIVPVLSAGDAGGLPFYIMPFVEGESVRARLERHQAFPIGDAVSVLRDVARALAYAHSRGVVHRDIKPDNVLLSGGTAVVTDFGIAKAVANSRTAPRAATLTQLGTSVGTPAYIAPEQAAGDPAVDHRADLYSFGCMAYELLVGQPPFANRTPQQLMAAHLTETPRPIVEQRANIPVALSALVMRCLEKDPAHRPQTAAELVATLESAGVSDATLQSAGGALSLGSIALGKALAIYAIAFAVVAVITKLAIGTIGLPDWVFPGSLVVMAFGLPVIVFAAFSTSPRFSFRRVALGGALAVGTFAFGVGMFMLLRAMGIGPAGSLIAGGKLASRERVILTEFTGPSSDSSLGPTVTEAFRADIGQSSNLSVLPVTTLHDVLLRMQKPASTRVDLAVARDAAAREGIKAIIDGEIVAIGGAYVISARLVSAGSGEELAAFRETATDAREIIPAIDRLSKSMRSKIGESLRTVQNAPPLERVTTPSIEALRKYAAGVTLLQREGDFDRGVSLLEEAIALDTGFAMAYRSLAIELFGRQLQQPRQQQLISKAYAHRDRLSDVERALTTAAYYDFGPAPDQKKVASAYESVLAIDPDNTRALNNLSLTYLDRRDFARAEQLLRHAAELEPTSAIYGNLMSAQVSQGKLADADRTIQLFARTLPHNPEAAEARGYLEVVRGNIDAAVAIADSLRLARPDDIFTQRAVTGRLGILAVMRGRLAEGLRLRTEVRQRNVRAGNRQAALNMALDEPELDLWFRGGKDRQQRAVRTIQQALAAHPLDSIPLVIRPYERLVYLYTLAARPDLAKPMVQGAERQAPMRDSSEVEQSRHNMAGMIAQAEGRYPDAVREFRAMDVGGCTGCALPDIARAYDLAGNADSAIAVFARYVGSTDRDLLTDQTNLAGAHKRLGELYEARGDRARAASETAAFIDLWKGADDDLQPLVADARKRLARLARAESER